MREMWLYKLQSLSMLEVIEDKMEVSNSGEVKWVFLVFPC